MAQPSKQRKRDAVGNLRNLADELGVEVGARNKSDMIEADFVELHASVLGQATTPQQRDRAAQALQHFRGQPPPAAPLPALPPLPALEEPMAAPPHQPEPVEPEQSPYEAPKNDGASFRLRSGSCFVHLEQ